MDVKAASEWFAKCTNIYLQVSQSFTGHMSFGDKDNRLGFMAARESGEVIITVIVIDEKLRNKGITTQLIKSLIDNDKITRVVVCGVGSSFMEAVLMKKYHEHPFVCHGGDFIWHRDAKYCSCHQFKDGKMIR